MATQDDKPRMLVSSTQDETYQRCKRLWYLLYPLRTPVPPKGYFDFGTVLHSVCERYLRADDLGRDEDGKPVELFPDGWDITEGRRLPPVESALIRKLIDKAIEEGILERRPGRYVEHRFSAEVRDGVDMVGLVDLMLPGEIQDHKTTKAMKWAKSPATLAESLQMLNYAKLLVDADPTLGWVTLRHNVYCKDPDKPQVKKVETKVSRRTVEENWSRLKVVAWEMVKLRDTKPRWQDVEGPSQPDACSAYGGCPMRTLCAGKETLEAYTARVERQIEHWNPLQKPATWDDKWGRLSTTERNIDDMDIFQRRKGPQQTAPEAPQINGGVAPAATPSEAPVATTEAPPWAYAGCKACSGSGLNSRGNPCRICDSYQRKAGGPTSLDFALETDPAGNLTWKAKDGSASGSAALPATGEVKASETVETPTPAEVAMSEPEPQPVDLSKVEAEDSEPEPEPEPEEKPEPAEKPKRGRPAKGFRLYVNCLPVGVRTTPGEQVFNQFCDMLAEQQKVSSYYDLDPFKRREIWPKVAEKMSDELGSQHVVIRNPSGSPDVKAFVDALRIVAKPGQVVEGLS